MRAAELIGIGLHAADDAPRRIPVADCAICQVNPALFLFSPCGHVCCVGCAVRMVREALGNVAEKFPFRCEFCRAEAAPGAPPAPLPIADLLRCLPAWRAEIEALGERPLSAREMGRFWQCHEEAAVPATQRMYCPAPNCGTLTAVVGAGEVARALAAGGQQTRCHSCRATFCLGCCTTPWHAGVTCDQLRGGDAATADFIVGTTRPCPHCHLRATHFRGHHCHHITCPNCRGRWCYSCGRAMAAGSHRCDSPGCITYCSDSCTCPDCPDCAPGRPCRGELACPNDGRCRVCQPRDAA